MSKQPMSTESIALELGALASLTVSELRVRFLEVFGQPSASRNKQYLYKRIAYRMQERSEGRTLSPDARACARELAAESGPRVRPPAGALAAIVVPSMAEKRAARVQRDPRLPAPGATMKRVHKGTEYCVTVLEVGFEYDGKRYPSLSSVARAITGTSWNGFMFFADSLRTP